MKKPEPKNMAASVRDRLKNLMGSTGQDYTALLTRFTIERFLYRLSVSRHRERFVLKGALLFALWQEEALHRITRDLDLLGFGESSINGLEQVFREICAIDAPDDGVVFHPDTVRAEPIRAHELYVGMRLMLEATIGSARTRLQADVGFGDATAVDPIESEFPSLLDLPCPKIRAYRMETTIAEKYQAAVSLGLLNSRMKDFFDFYYLGRHFSFDGQRLADSISATFKRRGAELPEGIPAGFGSAFRSDPGRQAVWKSFWKKSVRLDPPLPLEEAVSFAASFVIPPALAAAQDKPFAASWKPGGPWIDDHGDLFRCPTPPD